MSEVSVVCAAERTVRDALSEPKSVNVNFTVDRVKSVSSESNAVIRVSKLSGLGERGGDRETEVNAVPRTCRAEDWREVWFWTTAASSGHLI